MKENRLGPRQWAFVVVAGGTVFALPFMQRRPEPKTELPVVDAVAALLPEANSPVATIEATTAAPTTTSHETASPQPAAAWPALAHSPFDELVQQRAIVPDSKPTEEIVPMHPLRPWISAPNLKTPNANDNSAASRLPSGPSHMSPIAADGLTGRLADTVAHASPWRDAANDRDPPATDQPTVDQVIGGHAVGDQVISSFGHGRKQLPVNAGPADQYTVEEIAQKLNLSPQELATQTVASERSAIVPPDQVLPAPQIQVAQPSKPAVVLSRQPILRPQGAQVRFGESQAQLPLASAPLNQTPLTAPEMIPLPTLPPERRSHVITQPKSHYSNR